MDFIVNHSDAATVVVVPEDSLEAKNTPEFKSDIRPILDAHDRIVLDMGGLRFVDSSGCGALLFCQRIMQEKGGFLAMCHTSPRLSSVFRMIRIDKKIPVCDTLEEAVAAMGKAPETPPSP
jgi:anti-anti-sigma factor